MTSLKTHLLRLLAKHKISPDITLAEFGRKNYHKIRLCFLLLDQTLWRYEYVSEASQPNLRLIDALLASMASPVLVGAYPLLVQDVGSEGYITKLRGKLANKLEPNVPQRRFWSS